MIEKFHHSGRRVAGWTLTVVMAAALAACGGGGGNPGTTVGNTGGSTTPGTGGTGTVAAPTVSVGFVNASGQATNALSASTPLIARATVRDATGKPVPNALVAFATDDKLALFSPSAGTALTDANGVATVSLRPANLSAGGAGKVTATSTVGTATVTGESNFSVGATALTLGAVTLTPASIPAYGSTVVSVDVLASGARYTDQQVNVTFSSACVAAGKATLAASVPSNNGTAQAVYRDQGCASNDVITASTDGVSRPSSAPLGIAAPAAASVQFASADPVEKSLVIKGQGGISRTETATLKFRVFDIFNRPLPRQKVRFSVSPIDVVQLNKQEDSTDENGEVITTVNSLAKAGTFRVRAELDGRSDIFTLSDSIVVTTGSPVQSAFSLSSTAASVDASLDKIHERFVQVMLADEFGNPVADGTPVVFQTNLGAVGSSGKGSCNTQNGVCQVDFRTQNPRVALPGLPVTPCNKVKADSARPGVATICASTTDGTNTVFGKIAIFFSTAEADRVYLDGSSTPLSSTSPNVLSSVGADSPKVFTLQINDSLGNPMPVNTTVSVTSLVNARVIDVLPAKVPNIFPHSSAGDDVTGGTISGNQGSTHRFTLASDGPKPCTAALDATFNVAITTPNEDTTSYPFKLTFTCP